MVSLPIVLYMFISFDCQDGVLKNKVMEILKENNLGQINCQNFSSQVNDLTPLDMKFPEEISRRKIVPDRKPIREKTMDDKNHKDDVPLYTPIPLYSLVKNECQKGYVMDENGVCQKAIMARGGKTFDLERRKRFALDADERSKVPFYGRYYQVNRGEKVSNKIVSKKKGKVDLNLGHDFLKYN